MYVLVQYLELCLKYMYICFNSNIRALCALHSSSIRELLYGYSASHLGDQLIIPYSSWMILVHQKVDILKLSCCYLYWKFVKERVLEAVEFSLLGTWREGSSLCYG